MYTVKRTGVELVDRNLDDIANVLAEIQPARSTFFTFVSLGNNGVGNVALVSPKMPDSVTPLYRALSGMLLVAVIDLTSGSSLQTSFEQELTGNDAIRQLSSVNLSANKIVFILQG